MKTAGWKGWRFLAAREREPFRRGLLRGIRVSYRSEIMRRSLPGMSLPAGSAGGNAWTWWGRPGAGPGVGQKSQGRIRNASPARRGAAVCLRARTRRQGLRRPRVRRGGCRSAERGHVPRAVAPPLPRLRGAEKAGLRRAALRTRNAGTPAAELRCGQRPSPRGSENFEHPVRPYGSLLPNCGPAWSGPCSHLPLQTAIARAIPSTTLKLRVRVRANHPPATRFVDGATHQLKDRAKATRARDGIERIYYPVLYE